MTVASDPNAQPAPHGLTYTGRTGELFSIFFTNLGLTILSLGIYRFWGKVRMRRYLWSHVLFQGEPFGYSGNGKELFKGFLKVLFLLIIPALLIWQAITMLALAALESFGLILLVSILTPYLIFLVRRYRLSRSDWRCIRFQQQGSARIYALKALRGWFLNLITLAFYVPYNAVRLFDYQLNRIYFGTLPFVYQGQASDLARPYRRIWFFMLLFGFLMIILMIVAGVMAFTQIKTQHATPVQVLGHMSVMLVLMPLLLWGWVLAFFIARLKYRLLIYRHVTTHTSVGYMRAEFTATFWQFFRLKFGNGLIISLSLGLLSPIALHRRMKFLCRHLKFQGLPDFPSVQQIPSFGKTGEGWTHWLDVDALDF